jgi:uncharacterized membrane protein YeaQ/YmgE (transglycosylase-associated protein family)
MTMGDKADGKRPHPLWIVAAMLIGAFAGAFVGKCFFSYPAPLPAWVHPGVFAIVGASVGLVIALAVRRSRR